MLVVNAYAGVVNSGIDCNVRAAGSVTEDVMPTLDGMLLAALPVLQLDMVKASVSDASVGRLLN